MLETRLFTESDHAFFDLLYLESKVRLPGSRLNNPNINYYASSNDDKLQRPMMYIPSRVYIFKDLDYEIDAIVYGTKTKEPDREKNCAVHIFYPYEEVTRNLMLKCHIISSYQFISELSLEGLYCDNFDKRNVFAISKNVVSVSITDCILPKHVAVHLQQQLSECSGLKSICFIDTKIEDATFLCKLKNMTFLTSLKLVAANLSPAEGQLVCKQLKTLNQLHDLWIEIPGLGGHGQYISESLEKWGPDGCLKTLWLRNCDISADVCSSLVSSLPKGLEFLHLSGNTLTGCLQHLSSLDSLTFIGLSRTFLTKEDLHHFNQFIKEHKLLQLRSLWLADNKLNELEEALYDILESFITYRREQVVIKLYGNNFSWGFQKRLQKICDKSMNISVDI